MKAFKNLIGGEWVDAAGGEVFENRNPAREGEVLGTFPRATREEVARAIAAALEALPGWAKRTGSSLPSTYFRRRWRRPRLSWGPRGRTPASFRPGDRAGIRVGVRSRGFPICRKRRSPAGHTPLPSVFPVARTSASAVFPR